MQFPAGEDTVTCINVSYQETPDLELIIINKISMKKRTQEVTEDYALRFINVRIYILCGAV